MYNNEKNIESYFVNWLTITLILIFLTVIVGGLTRLTNSGLSITEWELFTGLLPPLNENSWNNYFELYKKIPQYKLLNNNMNIEEFKTIFYWEYFHRILGRVIGLFFLIPLIYFYFSKKIDIKLIKNCFLIFFLILIQGFVGWYMVISGLVNDITVSHYRLSLHLTLALIILSIIFWILKNIKSNKKKNFFIFSKQNLPFQILIILIFSQIILGAFVSGLDAGKIYQSWPLMGNSYFPNDFNSSLLSNFLDFENHSLVQFYHRNLAYFLVIYVFFLSFYIFKNSLKILYKPLILFLLVLFIQINLGIFTLLKDLNIYYASAHQITGVILVFTSINLYYSNIK